MSKTISIQVNQEKLVNNLRYAFSNSETVLSELMQNARRAGASSVDFHYDEERAELVITDDGCGIRDLQDLLTVADSGWSEQTQHNETPYGMGWLSCLFAAKHVLVQSGNQQIAFETKDVLSFRDIEIENSDIKVPGTRIVLSHYCKDDVPVTMRQLKADLDGFATGFPIQVYLNGEALNRPHARNSGKPFCKTAVGDIYYPGYEDDVSVSPAYIGMRVYLQGLPVYSNNRIAREKCIIVHLDPRAFFARLPDRDRLIDEGDKVRQIEEAIAEMWRRRFEAMIQSGQPERLLEQFNWTVIQNTKVGNRFVLQPILNRVNAIPRRELYGEFDYPRPACDDSVYTMSSDNCDSATVTREQIESGEVSIHEYTSITLETTGLFMFLYRSGRYMIETSLFHEDHWIHRYINTCKEAKVRPVNPQPAQSFVGDFASTEVVFCDAYEITLGKETCLITDAALGLHDGYGADEDGNWGEPVVYVPAEDPGDGEVITQVCLFIDEWDSRNDELMYKDIDRLEDFIRLHREKDPVKTLEKWIDDISMIHDVNMHGHYQLTINASGVTVHSMPGHTETTHAGN